MFCVLSPLSCAKPTACYPSLKTTTARGLIVGFFDLKHMSMNHYPVPLSAADTISSAGPSPPPHPPPPRGCDKPIFSRQFGPRSGPTKCLMFCSRNKGADKTVRCAQADLRMLRSRGTYICKRVVNQANSEMSGFTDFKFTV